MYLLLSHYTRGYSVILSLSREGCNLYTLYQLFSKIKLKLNLDWLTKIYLEM